MLAGLPAGDAAGVPIGVPSGVLAGDAPGLLAGVAAGVPAGVEAGLGEVDGEGVGTTAMGSVVHSRRMYTSSCSTMGAMRKVTWVSPAGHDAGACQASCREGCPTTPL